MYKYYGIFHEIVIIKWYENLSISFRIELLLAALFIFFKRFVAALIKLNMFVLSKGK